MADSVEYKLRYAVSSPLPGTMVRSWFKNDRLKREFIVPPSAGVAWPRGRRVQRQNAERAVAPGARARCGPTPFGVACGRKARPALRVMGRYRDRAGESAKWNGAIAWIPRIRMLSGPRGPRGVVFLRTRRARAGSSPGSGTTSRKNLELQGRPPCLVPLPSWLAVLLLGPAAESSGRLGHGLRSASRPARRGPSPARGRRHIPAPNMYTPQA